jgi:hypothetical protein
MADRQLINDLKNLLADLIEQEQLTDEPLQLSGLQFARVNLEVTLEKNGISRTTTLNNVVEKTISAQ